MKKVFFLVLMSCFLFSCSSDENENEEKEVKNELVGSKWQTSYNSTSLQVIEFTTKTDFMSYRTDKSGNIITTVELGSRAAIEYGEYVLKDDELIFGEDVRLVSSSFELLKTAKLKGSVMTVTVQLPTILGNDLGTKEKIFTKK